MDVPTPNPHDGRAELLGAQLAECVDVGGVSLHDVGEQRRPFLDEGPVPFDGEDLAALLDQLLCRGGTEPSQPDDQHGGVVGGATRGVG
jgi:hypothetical protein